MSHGTSGLIERPPVDGVRTGGRHSNDEKQKHENKGWFHDGMDFG
jgi:hypothetical protein